MAAGMATLDVFEEQQILKRASELAPYFEEGIHTLKGLPHVIDIRNYGLMGAIEFTSIPDYPAKRVDDIFNRCFENGLFVRNSGNNIVLSPPLICEKHHIDRIIDTLTKAITESAKVL